MRSFTNSILGLSREDSTSYTRDPRGTLLSERLTGGAYYYLFDGIGSTVALTDSAGNIANTYSYEPYGKLVSSTGAVPNPWRFTGGSNGYYETATGLYKIGLRYYDPSLGRWTQRDTADAPLSEHGSNPYAYTGDDPINFTDPSGAMKCRSIFKSWVCKALRKFAQTHATISWCEGFCVGLVLHPGGHVSLAGSPCCGYGRLSAIFTANKPTNGLAAQSCLYVCLGESAPPKWGNLAVGLGTPGGSFGPWYYLDLW